MLFICSCDCLNTGGFMKVKIMKNNKLWMEDNAIRQLESIADFKGVESIVGLPDLHMGKQPVGCTVCTKQFIYPFLIGNDIGCGITLYETQEKTRKIKVERLVKKLENTGIYRKYSIGGGNHFIELTAIGKVYNQDLANQLGIDTKKAYLLIHSGSRAIGESIYREYASLEGLEEGSERFNSYIEEHDKAVAYARDNRNHLADIFTQMANIKSDNRIVIDCIHNYLEMVDGKYYHRKGSISSLGHTYAIITGTRGSCSYIVKTIPRSDELYSVSHGCGRKIMRSECKGKLQSKYKRDELKRTSLGSYVISKDKALLYEEATEAYKRIDDVIETLLQYKCIEIIATLKPMVTYKC